MLKLALRDTRASALRLLLSVIAVLLGVSFVSGTFSLRNIMSSTFSDIIDTGYQAAAYVTPESGTGSIIMGTSGDLVIPLDLATSIGGFEGVAAAVPDLSGQVILVGADGTAVTGSGGAPSLGFGANPDDPTLVVSEGEAPRNSSEVVLETSTAERAGLSIGDSTRIIANGEIYGVTVTGLATY
ncbi:ABC transporter permease, partial [Timonella senegalensis]